MKNNNKTRAMFWLLAVVYLGISSYRLIKNLPSAQGNTRIAVIVGIVIFILAAIFILVSSIMVLRKEYGLDKNKDSVDEITDNSDKEDK